MAEDMKKGIFIVFDGPDGSGKSTQSELTYDDLISKGNKVVYTSEPGDTALGKMARDILLASPVAVGKITELFLFEADRAQHIEEVIKPALLAGKIVICDRFNTATFAYQGYGLGMDLDVIKKVDDIATGGLVPDLTIILDVDVNLGLKRAGKVGPADKMEKRSKEFHERVRKGYLEIARQSPDRIKVVSVRSNVKETHAVVKDIVDKFIDEERM
ncbi:MAG: dTMP kinase [Candidatus Omnitrophica bacterium]|nr:dTMP kinase [Candidatus Omnitrophota bacterium]